MKNVIAIFDIGKTNKKLLLFDEDYKIVLEQNTRIREIKDEDDFPAEDLESLRSFILDAMNKILSGGEFHITAVNFSAYGASFIYLNERREVIAPLYNYLKPYPENLHHQFYQKYGGEENFSLQTASPVLGNLNSGMQLYRIKYEKPELFRKIRYAMHLPQYLSFLLSGCIYSELTSIGCHTGLWDFKKNAYHTWVEKEGLLDKMPPIVNSNRFVETNISGSRFHTGVGLHDSSAALLPYLIRFNEPFILISTGTWCITLNPFLQKDLTADELKNDCLFYLQYNGAPVKAARLFTGYEYEEQVERMAIHFNTDTDYLRNIPFDPVIIEKLQKRFAKDNLFRNEFSFGKRDLSLFPSAEAAYHQLMVDLVEKQRISSDYVLGDKKIKNIYVDGGFSRNEIYMNLMAAAFPDNEILSSSMAQASGLGSALILHEIWNTKTVPENMIELKSYSGTEKTKR